MDNTKMIRVGAGLSLIGMGLVLSLSTSLIPILIFGAVSVGGLLFASYKQGNKKIKKILSSQNEMSKDMIEAKVLRVAADLGGKVTSAEIALKAQISLAEASSILDFMHESGYAELELTESGAVVYHFKGFLSDDERQNSIGLLD